jgi:ribosomal protein S18 acetylase RimI-like enzyme
MAGAGGVRAMTVHYRTAVAGEAEPLMALFHRCFGDTFGHMYDPEDLATFFDGHTVELWTSQLESGDFAIRIAEDGDQLAGFIKLGPLRLPAEPAGQAIELRQLYVRREWHGSGVANELMRWGIAEARQHGAGELYLSVFTRNHRARAFYARYGFEVIGPYTFMVGKHADEDVIMRLAL